MGRSCGSLQERLWNVGYRIPQGFIVGELWYMVSLRLWNFGPWATMPTWTPSHRHDKPWARRHNVDRNCPAQQNCSDTPESSSFEYKGSKVWTHLSIASLCKGHTLPQVGLWHIPEHPCQSICQQNLSYWWTAWATRVDFYQEKSSQWSHSGWNKGLNSYLTREHHPLKVTSRPWLGSRAVNWPPRTHWLHTFLVT